MIHIKNLYINESNYLHILPVAGYYDITTGISEYDMSPSDGGINIILDLDIKHIETGFFYITQKCNKHHVYIEGESGSFYKFNSGNEIFKDTKGTQLNHFAYYSILNNKIKYKHTNIDDVVTLFDAPFKELLPKWKKLEFFIEFESYFQYSIGPNFDTGIMPLLSFKWTLGSEVYKVGNKWKTKFSKFTSPARIKENIIYYKKH